MLGHDTSHVQLAAEGLQQDYAIFNRTAVQSKQPCGVLNKLAPLLLLPLTCALGCYLGSQQPQAALCSQQLL